MQDVLPTKKPKIAKPLILKQKRYAKAQPVPVFDFSIPRDVYIQIYNVVTSEARTTYSVITSITGEVIYSGPSIGYAIPCDAQLTNPLQPAYEGTVIEQAEPNGLFSSKNTDGTWVLFVDSDGSVTPIYTEQKVTTFPFAVVRNSNGEWVRADSTPASMKVNIKQK